MAAWQFKVNLIPKTWISSGGVVDDLYEEDGRYNTEEAWVNYTAGIDVKQLISGYFVSSKAWHQDLYCFGDEESTDVQVWYDDGLLDDIQFRFDLRMPVVSDVCKMIEISQVLHCNIFIPDQRLVIEPVLMSILRCAKESKAFLFVNDVEAWVNEVKKT